MSNQKTVFTCEGKTATAHKLNILSIKRSIRKLLPIEWSIIYLHLHEVIRIPNHKPIIDTTVVFCMNGKKLQDTIRYVTIEDGDDMIVERLIIDDKQRS